jgi:hypothetical protein
MSGEEGNEFPFSTGCLPSAIQLDPVAASCLKQSVGGIYSGLVVGGEEIIEHSGDHSERERDNCFSAAWS